MFLKKFGLNILNKIEIFQTFTVSILLENIGQKKV